MPIVSTIIEYNKCKSVDLNCKFVQCLLAKS